MSAQELERQNLPVLLDIAHTIDRVAHSSLRHQGHINHRWIRKSIKY
jgi:hypothetical protein